MGILHISVGLMQDGILRCGHGAGRIGKISGPHISAPPPPPPRSLRSSSGRSLISGPRSLGSFTEVALSIAPPLSPPQITEEQRWAILEFIAHLSTEDWEAMTVDLQCLGFIPQSVREGREGEDWEAMPVRGEGGSAWGGRGGGGGGGGGGPGHCPVLSCPVLFTGPIGCP